METILLVHPGEPEKFLEVTWDGNQVEVVEGTRGTAGATKRRQFAVASDAAKFVTALVTARRADGYRQVDDTDEQGEQNEALYDHIRQAPEDDARYLVLGDWLQQRGHPRGELIALQRALADAPNSRSLKQRIARLLDMGAPQIFGDLADDRDIFEVEWRLGFAERVHLFRQKPGALGLDTRLLTKGFLSHPTCRFVRRLVLAFPGYSSTADYEELLSGLADSPPMPTVRSLQVGEPETWPRPHIPADVARVLPKLEQLVVFGADVSFEEATFESLRSLSTYSYDPKPLERCGFPRLERLAITMSMMDAFEASRLRDQIKTLELLVYGEYQDDEASTAQWVADHGPTLAGLPSVVVRAATKKTLPTACERVATLLRSVGARVTKAPESFAQLHALKPTPKPKPKN